MRRALAVLIISAAVGIANTAGADDAVPIEHVLVLMQEDVTFDHYFGTYPGANGTPAGFTLPRDPDAPEKGRVAPYKLDVTRTISLPHSEKAMRSAFNGGSADGFVRAAEQFGAEDGALSLGYYDHNEIPFYWNLANEYVLADSWFSSVMGPSFTNHMYLYAASTGGYTSVPEEGMEIRTIFDALEEAGVSWKVYVQRYAPDANFRNAAARLGLIPEAAQLIWIPLLGIPRFVDDPGLSSRIVDLSEYYDDLKNDSLPAVSFIKANGFSEHPPGDIVLGQYASTDLLGSLMRSNSWDSSAFILTWDEWGGWFDHVSPPQVDKDGYGFRVPALIVSPYARRGYIDSTVYDHTSILKFIEWLFELPPLTKRDAQANNLLGAFDFTQPPRPPVAPAAVYEPAGGDGDSAADRTTLVSAIHTLALPVALGAFVAAIVAGWTIWRPWKRAPAISEAEAEPTVSREASALPINDKERGLSSRLEAVAKRAEALLERQAPPLLTSGGSEQTVPQRGATAESHEPDGSRKRLDLSMVETRIKRIEARIERLRQEVPLSTPGAIEPAVPPSIANGGLHKPDVWRIDVMIEAERNFATLLEIHRSLSDLPSSGHASVVAFRKGQAQFAVELRAGANGDEIAQALRDSSAYQFATEEVRPQDQYLRLRVLGATGD